MSTIQKLKKIPNPVWYSLTVFLLILSVCGIIIICIVWCFANQLIYSYGVIIDAGSTSTKIFLYKWPEIASRTNGEVSEVTKCKSAPGISDFMNDPDEAVPGIDFCVSNEITPKIPEMLQNKSFVYLGATAGMRLIEQRNPTAIKAIFKALENYLLGTGYIMKNLLADVKVISGRVEGVAAWITANYLKRTLQKSQLGDMIINKNVKTFGALDLGGASTQITFVPDKQTNKSGLVPIRLYGKNYNVYSHSYLCYGKSQAEYKFLSLLLQKWLQDFNVNTTSNTNLNNPCMLKGDSQQFNLRDIVSIPCVAGEYAKINFGFSIELPNSLENITYKITFNGTGDPEKCHTYIKQLFNVRNCSYERCGFNNIYQPKPNDKFLAFAGYYLVYKQLLVFSKYTSLSYKSYLSHSKSYCKLRPPKIKPATTEKERELEIWRKWRCFGFLYVYQLLTSLGFDEFNWKNIEFVNTINNSSLGWSLGYMINKTSMIPVEKPMIGLPLGSFIAILLTFLVALIIGCILAIISYRLHRLTTRNSKCYTELNLKLNVTDKNCEDLSCQT